MNPILTLSHLPNTQKHILEGVNPTVFSLLPLPLGSNVEKQDYLLSPVLDSKHWHRQLLVSVNSRYHITNF